MEIVKFWRHLETRIRTESFLGQKKKKRSASDVYFLEFSCITIKRSKGLAAEAKEGVWEE